MTRKLSFFVLFVWLSMAAPLVTAQSITVVTEQNTITYMKDGKVAGAATEFVEEVLRKAGFDFQIGIYPWARAVSMATSEKNVLIYSIARTAEREPQYKWVGEIHPVTYHFYKLRSRKDIAIRSLAEAKKYRVGVQAGDLRAKYLVQNGFEYGVHEGLQEVPDNMQNLRKLETGRVDVIPMSVIGMRGLCASTEIDCAKFEPAYTLDIQTHLYMAFSIQTADDIVERARQSYEALKKDGTYKKLLGDLL